VNWVDTSGAFPFKRLRRWTGSHTEEFPYGVYYGVSQNTWRFWDLDEARAGIGFVPQDNAERFRSEEALERP